VCTKFGLIAGLVVLALVGGSREEGPSEAWVNRSSGFDAAHIRAVVVEKGEKDPGALAAVRALGANTLVTHANPDGETARAAQAAGLSYIARMTTEDAVRAGTDPIYAFQLRAVRGLQGVYYEDDAAPEGYASPQTQQLAYASLKALFPGALVLHPTRLDPIAWDPTYLDATFRPQFTDLVTPYFYPVGTTVIGTFAEDGAWDARLESLLRAVAQRIPTGQGVLPVLQGFEQIGFPVDRLFPSRQMEVYGRVWPENQNAAVFAWRIAMPQPLIDLADQVQLQRGTCDLFARLSALPPRCRWTGVVHRDPLP
jgi:hypothetical protein